jgi:Xaa-Pro aminopeptidase
MSHNNILEKFINNHMVSHDMLYSPITPDDYLKRIKKTKTLMKESELDLLIVFSDAWRSANCRYLTGVRPYPGFFSEVPGYNQALIAIPLEGEPTLFWCDHTIEWAKRGVLGTIREEPWIEVKTWSEISGVVKEVCTKNKVKNIGFEGKDIIPWPVYESLKKDLDVELKDTNILKVQRRVKSEKEIKLLEVASNINDRICEELVRGIIRYGVTEKEIQRKIEELGHSMGAEYVDANFMQSRNVGWGHATDATIENRSLLSIHVILQYEGYNSDNDRIIGFGNINKKEAELAAITKDALKNFLNAVKPGAEAMEAIIAAVNTHDYVAAGEQGAGASGHGIGLEAEEELINEWVFEKGNVFTATAGAYNKDIKATWATEEVVVVTERGARQLTKFPIDYIIP